ncbi:MAG: bifunctional adenosylcobinamide kinase/adenosylcobinamide-phosphate guanylyltransferase [Candidatus Faecousia sp.]|nr:bifunctional adenosylcobinamide kinase/adenosylcobinamide-phosphate guanylyltransferase [Bacillota bacterium]MDY4754442.1 bifunctional adenosylcobinamide kinase/adenosylcobinamide-phosphate guanylyltransferase [Candidatus Faecousia sp.]MDY6161555.1 bifunctional adenosylcobinamide kinase/adenosylcobinamide-phosphate guanylyltransferase [Candidatus Faecousia sp.]
MIVFITGGAKNGKSSLAQRLAVELAKGGPHYYIATMIPVDEEDRERIRRHVADREGLGFETVECGRDILSCLSNVDKRGSFLLDSTTALLMNELFIPPDYRLNPTVGEKCADELVAFAKSVANIVVVSDYIYSDALQYDEVTETYRRALAMIDRRLAAVSDVVLELTVGNVVVHKGDFQP